RPLLRQTERAPESPVSADAAAHAVGSHGRWRRTSLIRWLTADAQAGANESALMNAEQHSAGERAFGHGQRVERRQGDATRPTHDRNISPEYLHEPVRECDAREPIGSAAPGICFKHARLPQPIARRIDDYLRELERIAHAEIEALTGDGVQRLRGVSDHDDA